MKKYIHAIIAMSASCVCGVAAYAGIPGIIDDALKAYPAGSTDLVPQNQKGTEIQPDALSTFSVSEVRYGPIQLEAWGEENTGSPTETDEAITLNFNLKGSSAEPVAPVIRSVGEYLSPLRTTKLLITNDDQNVKFRFSFKGADGRVTTVENQCGVSNRWACLIQGEMTVWFYKGGDTVTVVTIIEKEGSSLEFSSATGVFNIKAERDLIPKAFLEFIEAREIPKGRL